MTKGIEHLLDSVNFLLGVLEIVRITITTKLDESTFTFTQRQVSNMGTYDITTFLLDLSDT